MNTKPAFADNIDRNKNMLSSIYRLHYGFRPETRYHPLAVIWLDFLSLERGVSIQHRMNRGERLIVFGQRHYYADGWLPGLNQGRVFEFNG